MKRIHKLHELNQSLWYDNIQRKLLVNGELEKMIAGGLIRGVTSNPSIFHNAIAKSSDYDAALKPMAWSGWSTNQIFYQLVIEDIQQAADLFLELYRQTGGADGYVSLEVSPLLASETVASVAEAKRLWKLVDRPNLMVKIPATKEGIPAIRQAIAAGINVNATLIFSLDRYKEVIDAYMCGLEDRLEVGLPIDQIASVASFFVSRVDTKVDKMLEEIAQQHRQVAKQAKSLMGRAAVANARLAYSHFLVDFASERFKLLKEHGARPQRPLWASTSTKNPAYRDVIYVEELIGADSVNTVPPQTLEAFADHGKAVVKLGADVQAEMQFFDDLDGLGISMQQVTAELEVEGVQAFADAFTALLETLEERRASAQAELGLLGDSLPAQIVRMEYNQVMRRIYNIEPGLWIDDPDAQKEIQNRLGWLVLPQSSRAIIPEIEKIVVDCIQAGYKQALLLGMGGSSLAPEVLRLVHGVGKIGDTDGLDLDILDSTDPTQVKAAARHAPIEESLYIVSSKSGTTSEVSAFLEYFWDKASAKFGSQAGAHFIAITDPGTKLEKLARERGFRAVVSGDTMVGGRYSALSAFGLLPAALIGMDIHKLLRRGSEMMEQCLPEIAGGRNPGLVLGTLIGEAALEGRDKLTIIADPEFEAFGSWLEQLIAESTGKNGRGIIPIDIEPEMEVIYYGEDRLFVYLRSSGKRDEYIRALRSAGHPVVELHIQDAYDLGAEFYRWEIATAVACAVLGVDAFNQPDVQDNKNRTTQKINAYKLNGVLDSDPPVWEGPGGRVYGLIMNGLEQAKTLKDVVHLLLKLSRPGDYVAVNAYLPRNPRMLARLQKMRKTIMKQTGCATTLGFGPRFLHSTGQLHKGGANNGIFLQITADQPADVMIPDMGFSFGTLELAQALGDLEALLNRDRRVIRIHLTDGRLEDLV